MFKILLCNEFSAELKANEFDPDLTTKILSSAKLLQEAGPNLGRPWCDTLKGSKYKNMKELRIRYDSGQWRVAFAFDRKRNAVLLVAANKVGQDQKRFYNNLISVADARLEAHLASLE